MDEISEKLAKILNNPDELRQITELAKNMGLINGEDNIPLPETSAALQTAADLGRILQQAEKADEKQEALFHAIRPYLKPSRQNKLDRALKLAKLSHLAGAALKTDSA